MRLPFTMTGDILMKVFDFHTHIYPERIAEKAAVSVREFYNMPSDLIGTSKELLEVGKRAGIEKFLILPVAIRPDQVKNINLFVSSEVAAHEEYYGFGTVHAGMEGICDEVDNIKALGLRGIKMHPDTQGFSIDDERLFPMYDMIQGDIPVIFHSGDPRYDYSHPRKIKRILEMFPRLTVIAAHFGGWSLFEEALENLKDTDCYVDVSSSMMFQSREETMYYISQYGVDRVLFGSDYPLGNPERELQSFLQLKLSDSEREKILYRNATELLGIKW